MIQADDRRRLGEAVALHDDESELAPERLERAVERRRADDKRPEFQAEHAMNPAEMPPAPHPVPRRARARRLRRDAQHVLAQDIEDLRYRHDDGDPPLLHLRDDVDRVVAAHEHDDAAEHRRDECRHRLPEHVAERQQIQKAERIKRRAPLPILQDFFFDGDDVREDVAMRDDDALRLGRRARGEDDFGGRVPVDRRLGRVPSARRLATRARAASRLARLATRCGSDTSCPTSTSLADTMRLTRSRKSCDER